MTKIYITHAYRLYTEKYFFKNQRMQALRKLNKISNIKRGTFKTKHLLNTEARTLKNEIFNAI